MASLTFAIILVNAVLILAEGESEMQKLKVVPDVIDKVPGAVLEVSYPGGVKVDNGNVLTPTKVKEQPSVKWDGADSDFYTLAMVDPDAPSRKEPKYREWHHWLVGNIPGNKIEKGEVLSAYIGAGPPKGTDLHRYVLLLYKQQGKETFPETKLTNTSGKDRGSFKIKDFAKKHNLGEPIAGNFFQAEWDDYVPTLYKQLGAK